jgi:uncharacterized RDD family membrane protein YckC
VEPPRNPFETPRTAEPAQLDPPEPGLQVLAEPGTRLTAAIFDTGLSALCFLPCLIIVANEDWIWAGVGVSVLILLGLSIYQWILLTQTGQSLGKRWTRIKVVRTNGQAADFVHVVLLRVLVMGMVQGLVGGCGSILSLVDVLFIFREDRRCIHDHLADTKVVVADRD